jgi:CP family cyanate transporter-like MFS transporter
VSRRHDLPGDALTGAPPVAVSPPVSPPVPPRQAAPLEPELVVAAPVGPLPAARPVSGRAAAMVVLGVVLVAVNLRSAVTSLGSLLPEVTGALGMSATLAGVVTMLPTFSFAAFGIATPWLAGRFTPSRILVAAMAILAAGQALRAITDSVVVFLVCTALALSGIAVANVLLPALVKQYFPHRVGLLTGVYTMSLIFGTSTAAAAAVPVAQLGGSWRVGLGAWAVLAVVAAIPWLPAALRHRRPAGTAGGVATRPERHQRVRAGRTTLGWAMAVFFGTQSLSAYAIMGWLAQLFRDAGFAAAPAGILLASVMALGAPAALLVPTFAARMANLRPVVLGLSAVTAAGYVGLAVAPRGAAVVWVLLLAAGQAAFPLGLTMIGLRSRTAEGTVALSAFTQSGGYLLAGLGPLLVGVLYEATGGWSAPLGFLLVVLCVHTAAGLVVVRPGAIEDAVRPRRRTRLSG